MGKKVEDGVEGGCLQEGVSVFSLLFCSRTFVVSLAAAVVVVGVVVAVAVCINNSWALARFCF